MKYTLSLLKIPVSNVSVSKTFYITVLKFKQVFFSEIYGWAQLQCGDIELALYEPNKGGGNRQVSGDVDFHLRLNSDDFEKLAQELLKLDVLKDQMIHQGNDKTYFVEVVDPDNNIIKIIKHNCTATKKWDT